MKTLGHRGCIITEGPYQNSIKAFELAIKHSDGFETDACVSNDGEIFFIHEEIFESGSLLPSYLHAHSIPLLEGKNLNELSSTQIQKLKLKDEQHIPRWDETLALFKNNPNKIFNIEVKGEHAEIAVIKKLKQAFVNKTIQPEQIVISSFNHPVLLKIKTALPQIKIGALFMGKNTPKKPLLPWSTDTESYYFPFTQENINRDLIHKINPHYIIVPHTELNDNSVELIKNHKSNLKLIVWTSGGHNEINIEHFNLVTKKYADEGILDTIIVDEPHNK